MVGYKDQEDEIYSSTNAYRTDLADAVGIVILPPVAILDMAGQIIGDRDDPESPAGRYFGSFRIDVETILDDVSKDFSLDESFKVDIQSQEYAQPPAAQGMQELAFWLWEHGPSILMTLDAAVNVGKAIREATKRIRQIPTPSPPMSDEGDSAGRQDWEKIQTYWPQSSVSAAVVSDAASRYGIAEDSVISIFPRGNEYLGGPNHPNPSITYLIRIDDGPRTLVYSVRADGTVVEHFQLAGDRITPLELPDLIGESSMRVVAFPASRLQLQRESPDTSETEVRE